jgi:hypothetical protein
VIKTLPTRLPPVTVQETKPERKPDPTPPRVEPTPPKQEPPKKTEPVKTEPVKKPDDVAPKKKDGGR